MNMDRIYAIYDMTAQQVLKANISFVMLYPNDAVAARDFTEMCNDKNTPMWKYPDEFHLVCIGDMDTTTCTIRSWLPEEILTARRARELLAERQQDNGNAPESVRRATAQDYPVALHTGEYRDR